MRLMSQICFMTWYELKIDTIVRSLMDTLYEVSLKEIFLVKVSKVIEGCWKKNKYLPYSSVYFPLWSLLSE